MFRIWRALCVLLGMVFLPSWRAGYIVIAYASQGWRRRIPPFTEYLPLLYILLSTTALSLAQYRCLIEHWEKYRQSTEVQMGQIQRQHQICWSLRTLSLFLSSPIFQKWLPIYSCHSIMLALCCNTFLVVLVLFFHKLFCTYIFIAPTLIASRHTELQRCWFQKIQPLQLLSPTLKPLKS